MTATSSDKILNGPIFNIMTLSIFSQLESVSSDQFYFVDPQFDGGKILITDDDGNFSESDITVDDLERKGKPLNTLPTSGTVSPNTNSYNYIAPASAITLSLPTPVDITIMNEIELIINQTSEIGIDFGTILWSDDGTPKMSPGIWDFIFTYIPGVNKWIGSYKKWENS